ncbi:hypothetical protein VTI28DRAFT_8673 [Corynascus sepedonium]
MSTNEKQPGQQQYFPPPPPGPPPGQTTQTNPPKHPDETPLPDYPVPQFAPPPANEDDDLYNASPVDENPPKWGRDHGHHAQGSAGEAKKKTNRLSAFGHAFTSKVAGPVNALANKFGSEGFLPEPLDKECEKAARILRSFCKDGIYSDAVAPRAPTPAATNEKPASSDKPPASPKAKKSRVLLTIPSKVIARAQGLAIFTAVRLGFQATGSSGSGILLARLPDGRWSPPSGIQITSIGAGFVAGVDIYDCVIVINTREALEMFTKTRLSLGSDLAVTAGPFGAGGALDWGVPAGSDKQRGRENKTNTNSQSGADNLSPPPLSSDNTHFQTPSVPEHKQGMTEEEDEEGKNAKHPSRRPSPFRDALKKPVYSYVKSRGFYAGVQIDGTVIAARDNANAKFYGQPLPVDKILRGEVPHQTGAHAAQQQHGSQGTQSTWPGGAGILYDVLKGAEGGWKGNPQQQAAGQQGPLPEHTGSGKTPMTPGYSEPSPIFGAAPGTGGAPTDAWVPPPPPPGPPPTQAMYGVTAGMQNLGVGSSSGAAPPPAAGPSSASSAKATEAAAEAARAQQEDGAHPPPPSYSDSPDGDDLPPAYVEDERHQHYSGDSKTGLH